MTDKRGGGGGWGRTQVEKYFWPGEFITGKSCQLFFNIGYGRTVPNEFPTNLLMGFVNGFANGSFVLLMVLLQMPFANVFLFVKGNFGKIGQPHPCTTARLIFLVRLANLG